MTPWVAYLISESNDIFSGIVSIMFCGIAISKYAFYNVGTTSKKMHSQLYHTLAYVSENIVFLFIGIGAITFDLAWKEMGFFLLFLSFIVILVARGANIYGITWILNRYRRTTVISMNY